MSEEAMMIIDYSEKKGVQEGNTEKQKSCVKNNNMIQSVQQPRNPKSSKSKTKSIGKYTSARKKEEEVRNYKYHTNCKKRQQPKEFTVSSKKKYTNVKNLKSKKSELMDRMLNEKLSEKSRKINNLEA